MLRSYGFYFGQTRIKEQQMLSSGKKAFSCQQCKVRSRLLPFFRWICQAKANTIISAYFHETFERTNFWYHKLRAFPVLDKQRIKALIVSMASATNGAGHIFFILEHIAIDFLQRICHNKTNDAKQWF